jgi:hypothetical protein
MLFRLFTPLLALLLTASAFGGEGAAAPATRPAKGLEGYRYLDAGSWIVVESHVRTNGTPATMKRRIQITADPKTHERLLQESRWVNDAFAPTGEPQPLARPDRRAFDQLGFTPDSTAPEQVVTIGGKRYVCSVSTYLFDGQDGRVTRLTLWRDKSGATQLPPRAVSVNLKQIPLPQDALQADVIVEGPNVSTRTQRRILSMASPLRVNGQTCNCLVEGTETQGTSNGKPLSITVREWLCHDLPGERLRTVTAMTCGPMRVESDVTVLDFHVARLDAAIHAMPTFDPSAE